jgi:hypothetical protein
MGALTSKGERDKLLLLLLCGQEGHDDDSSPRDRKAGCNERGQRTWHNGLAVGGRLKSLGEKGEGLIITLAHFFLSPTFPLTTVLLPTALPCIGNASSQEWSGGRGMPPTGCKAVLF